jgi:NitT/TauT family transport system permease protein
VKPYYLATSFKTTATKKSGNPVNDVFFNFIAFLLILSAFTAIGWAAHQAHKPMENLQTFPITLDYYNLFAYSMRTCIRMFCALLVSVVFTLIYAKLASINSYFEQILIPILDVLQSVPILGFISFTVTIFLGLFPGQIIGAECACIFAIFTSQAWNMTFSFYQSLKNIPSELIDAASMMKMSAWQKFWRLEVPYGIPNLVFNIVVSISGGWFFVVASEVISVGNTEIALPGIGSYISLALEQGNMGAIYAAIAAIIIVIFSYDKLLLQPLLLWSEKFQYDANPTSLKRESFILSLFQKNLWINKIFIPIAYFGQLLLNTKFFNYKTIAADQNKNIPKKSKLFDYLWYGSMMIAGIGMIVYLIDFLRGAITISDILHVFSLSVATLIRICVMMTLASLVWVPIGIYIGSRPRLAQNIQPLVQFLSAFPINLLFPASAIIINYYSLTPNIWLSPLIIMGGQWYILFNVISGTLALPNDLAEVASNLQVKGLLWYRKVILPAIMPYFLTGIITAFGGAWNASIVAEVINFHGQHIVAYGIGSYIAEKTVAGDFHHISLGIIMMSLFVLLINRLIWRPLHNLSVRKFSFS